MWMSWREEKLPTRPESLNPVVPTGNRGGVPDSSLGISKVFLFLAQHKLRAHIGVLMHENEADIGRRAEIHTSNVQNERCVEFKFVKNFLYFIRQTV